jgi:chromosome segregation ATPase
MFTFFHLTSTGFLTPEDGGAGGSSESRESQESGNTEVHQGLTDDGSKRLEVLKAELEAVKKDSAGKDKSVTRLQKELDELKKAQMSAEERKAAEERERAEQAKEERRVFLQEVRTIAAELAGLEESDAGIIPGNTPEEIREHGRRIKDLLDTKFAAGFEKAKKEGMNGGTPQGGITPPMEKTVKKLNDLFKI